MELPFDKGAIVVTSIAGPIPVLQRLAEGATSRGSRFIMVGDSKTPESFQLDGCDFSSLASQRKLPFAYAALCHEKSYTRKNIGYLLAMAGRAQFIVETDDDNFPREEFWLPRTRTINGDRMDGKGWLNAYHYFSDREIYPRGFPLESVRDPGVRRPARGNACTATCPIQQGLADDNPDVDAVYRLLFPLPLEFRKDRPLILAPGRWCPFNSQNTTFFPEVYLLLYLPTYCTFRMTDIWRSFVAQRILWTCGWSLSFESATVWQERNEHNLLRDFADEVPGYLNNARIAATLENLSLRDGREHMAENLLACYEALIGIGLIAPEERPLLNAWLKDCADLKLHEI